MTTFDPSHSRARRGEASPVNYWDQNSAFDTKFIGNGGPSTVARCCYCMKAFSVHRFTSSVAEGYPRNGQLVEMRESIKSGHRSVRVTSRALIAFCNHNRQASVCGHLVYFFRLNELDKVCILHTNGPPLTR